MSVNIEASSSLFNFDYCPAFIFVSEIIAIYTNARISHGHLHTLVMHVLVQNWKQIVYCASGCFVPERSCQKKNQGFLFLDKGQGGTLPI